MTQHISSPADQQGASTHPRGVTTTSVDREGPRGLSGWWIGLLALLPIACCGLPLLLVVAGMSAGSGAVLGGITGGVLMLAGAAVLSIWGMRRRARSRPNSSTVTTSPRDRCC